MSENNKNKSFSRSSKSYSGEKKEKQEVYRSHSGRNSVDSRKSKKASKSPENHRRSPSIDHKQPIKLPVFFVVDDEFFERLQRDGFALLEKVKSNKDIDTIKVEENLQVPELKGKVLNFNSGNDDAKFDASEYFAEKYVRSSSDYKDSSSINSLKILMPENIVSLFIGAKGKQIKQLMYETRTKIIVNQPAQVGAYRVITIQGELHYVKKSIRIIVNTFERLSQDKHIHSMNNRAKLPENRNTQVTANIILEDEIISHLDNKRDSLIRNIMKNNNVNIKIFDPPRNLNMKRDERICVR